MISRMSSFTRRECGVSYLILTIRWCRTVPRRTSGQYSCLNVCGRSGSTPVCSRIIRRRGVAPFAGTGRFALYLQRAENRSASGYRQAMRRMGTGERSTMFVGDQLFTDVYGARRTGIYSIIVKPINPKEENPDRVKAVSGENCPVVLCEKTGKKYRKFVAGCF